MELHLSATPGNPIPLNPTKFNAFRYASQCALAASLRLPALAGRDWVPFDNSIRDEDNKDWIPVVQNNVAPAKKRSLMPLLTVVFSGFLRLDDLLIVEQGDTIQSQRNLIQILLGDSTELWPRRKGPARKANGRSPAPAQNSNPNPSTHGQTPSTQTPSSQKPSTQAVPQHHSQAAQANRQASDPGSSRPGSTHACFGFRRSASRFD